MLAMSFDFDGSKDRLPPTVEPKPSRPDDLEAIVVLLELAAIMLTTSPESTFTVRELLTEFGLCGGYEFGVAECDVMNVLQHQRFMESVDGGTRLKLK